METTNNHLFKLLETVDEIYAPSTKPKVGHPSAYAEPVMLKVFLLLVLKKIKPLAALYRSLKAHPEAQAAGGLHQMPDESTLRKRLKKLAPTRKRQIRAWSQAGCKQRGLCAEVVAVDKKRIEAPGPLWHQSDRRANKIPAGRRGGDRDRSWSVSADRGGVQGSGLHLAVDATPGGALVPLWAAWTTHTTPEAKAAYELADDLPAETQRRLGDEAYDDPQLRAKVECCEHHRLRRAL